MNLMAWSEWSKMHINRTLLEAGSWSSRRIARSYKRALEPGDGPGYAERRLMTCC